ncbi:hypothetical protein FQN54_005730 [Arachnomyces sp. PD_36]|nr:hypothetical protein FQN54_005730 [Arachnomyces sp. PD_36]
MGSLRCSGSVSQILRSYRHSHRAASIAPSLTGLTQSQRRRFHASPAPWAIKSQVLKDVGEGITEIQIIQWYVQEGAHIEEWKPLCQYQSDKAVDDITSRYEGVIKKLHFQADDTVPTGKALCDIDVDDTKYPDDNPAPKAESSEAAPAPAAETQATAEPATVAEVTQEAPSPTPRSKHASLATPAVRGMLKEFNLNILDITGTGKDGRVMKEDVHRFVAARDAPAPAAAQPAETAAATPAFTRPMANVDTKQSETPTSLTPVQSGMFKSMTKSLNIPHFLYADELNVGTLSDFRKKLASNTKTPQKLSFLPFIIKAVSLSLDQYPLLNSRVDTTSDPNGKPQIIMRSNHNIGVAMDTPQGLLVPNIKNVGARSVLDIASELQRLSALAKAGKLGPNELTGGTITVSNIGNIGGTYVAPVIVQNEVAILGVGKSRRVPTYDDEGQVVPAELVNFSWSADHRVIDGATMARMADKVREYVESPEMMVLNLR